MRYSREDGCRAWLTYAELPPLKLRALLEDFGSAEAVYECVVYGRTAELKSYCNEKQLDRLLRRADKDAMHEMMQIMRSLDIGVMTFEDAIYPIALMDIHDPPPVLFYRGNPDAWNERCLTIVGSRRASPEAIHITEGIAKELSDCGVTIVSGLAFGIDSAAHRGCMEGKSPTVAVCAAGLDHVYPAENQPLVRRILDSGGALLCEFPLGSAALKWRFPARNRVLSGLSKGVLLMEARIRSGSMTTVQHALDQGREVSLWNPPPRPAPSPNSWAGAIRWRPPRAMCGTCPSPRWAWTWTQDFDLKYITIHGRGKILAKIRKEAKNASQIYLATDPDREGEAISWHLAQVLGIDPASLCRVEFHEITKKAVQQAMKEPRAIDMGRVDAQQARRALDRLVGYKISPLLWAKVKKGLSAGRVQSVATRMVVDPRLPSARAGKAATFTLRLSTLDGKKAELQRSRRPRKPRKRIRKGHFLQDVHPSRRKAQDARRALHHLQPAAGGQPQAELHHHEDHAGGAAALRGRRIGKRGHPGPGHLHPYRLRARQRRGHVRPAGLHSRPLRRGIPARRRPTSTRAAATPRTPTRPSAPPTCAAPSLRFYGEHKRFAGFTSVYEEGTDETEESRRDHPAPA